MGNYKTGLETKEKILSTARTLFYENGYVKTTLSQISKVSGVNKAMVSYYFGGKEKLGLEVYNEYMVAMKVLTQNAITDIFPEADALHRTAIELRLQSRNCRKNPNLNRFYHEMCDSNIFLKTESASIGFVENISRSLKMNLSALDVKVLSLSNLSVVHGLHIAWSTGFIDCSAEYLVETEIWHMLRILRIEDDKIKEVIATSKKIAEKINVEVGKNFKVKAH